MIQQRLGGINPETWVAVRGVTPPLCTENNLTLIRSSIDTFLRVDPYQLMWGLPKTLFRDLMDAQHRKWTDQHFCLGGVKVVMHLHYEKVKGLCRACGLLAHEADPVISSLLCVSRVRPQVLS